MKDNVLAKKGRPKGPETDVLYKRVPAADKKVLSDLVDSAIDGALDKWSERNKEYLKDGGWYFRQEKAVPLDSKPFVGADHTKPKETIEEIGNRVLKEREDLMLRLAISEKEDRIRLLEKENELLKRKIKEYENYST